MNDPDIDYARNTKKKCVISNSNSLCSVFDRFVGQVETMRLPAPAGVRKP